MKQLEMTLKRTEDDGLVEWKFQKTFDLFDESRLPKSVIYFGTSKTIQDAMNTMISLDNKTDGKEN